MASQGERDARLDELSSAVKTWAKQRREALNKQVTFAKGLLKGRKGMERLNHASVSSASILLTDEIDKFLTG